MRIVQNPEGVKDFSDLYLASIASASRKCFERHLRLFEVKSPGGALSVRSKDGQRDHLLLEIGTIPGDEYQVVFFQAKEQANTLARYKGEISSVQGRKFESRLCTAGGIRTSKFIISFAFAGLGIDQGITTAMAEKHNETFSLALGIELGLVGPELADRICKISGNELYYRLLVIIEGKIKKRLGIVVN